MTNEDYIKQCSEIDEQIKALIAEKDYATAEYFKHNAKFQAGDRVIVTDHSREEIIDVMIETPIITWQGICYKSTKVKKDGTLSKVNCWNTGFIDVTYELVERGYGQRMGFIKDEVSPISN